MKKVIRIILIVLLTVLIVMQFIRPDKNKSEVITANDITQKFHVPDSVLKVLQASCYDCHSNNTIYPWYAEVEPVGWWLNNHIKDGKRGLNFSEYGSYRLRKQYKRFDDINEEIKSGGMPLSSYILIHQYAKLSVAQKLIIANWTEACIDQMKATYPSDSLLKR